MSNATSVDLASVSPSSADRVALLLRPSPSKAKSDNQPVSRADAQTEQAFCQPPVGSRFLFGLQIGVEVGQLRFIAAILGIMLCAKWLHVRIARLAGFAGRGETVRREQEKL